MNLNPAQMMNRTMGYLGFKPVLKTKDKIFGFLLTLPALLVIFGFIVYPLLLGIINSFRKVNFMRLNETPWIGFENYRRLFADPFFWDALQNTLVYAIFTVGGGAIFGLLLALLLNKQTRTNRMLRGLFLIPWIMPGVIVAIIFRYMVNQQNGIVNTVLMAVGLAEKPVNFFAVDTAMPSVIIATIWLDFPFFMLMFLAGLKTIPKEIEDAAQVDGANGFERFRYVTLPYLKNVIVISTTLMTIWNFNFLDLIWTNTKGGPLNETETFVILAYRMGLINLDIGYASALGVVWLLMLVGFAYLYLKNMKVLGE